MLFFLIYVSTATAPMDEGQLVALMRQCREKNSRLGVTGMLLYKGGQFMQLLEGEEETVRRLYETIRGDARHTDVVTLEEGPLSARNYAAWSMGFCDMDDVDGLPALDAYLQEGLLSRTFHDVTEGAYDLLVAFSKMYR